VAKNVKFGRTRMVDQSEIRIFLRLGSRPATPSGDKAEKY
jgi:hypothetical protein